MSTEETPAIAGFLERLVAFYIDAKVFILGTGIVAMGLVACGLPEAAAGMLFPVSFFAYHVLLNSDRRQTAGKWIVGIRVLSDDATPLRKTAALKRAAAYILSAIPLGLGFFWTLFRSDKRAWHDSLSSSRVVEARPRGNFARVAIAVAAVLIVFHNLAGLAGYFHGRGLARAARMSSGPGSK